MYYTPLSILYGHVFVMENVIYPENYHRWNVSHNRSPVFAEIIDF